ncbi:putative baseplate assembly protein [Nocardioides sp. cx-173]|uniref:putative baseplate assembly protein n=1 Tax=Nocardioides sp. cx-173 TaxID=2898796 RepID=UPI001E62D897|nr:putative baseplate assembly protein [Nocardioides sp. cx-173]MCD4525972.1 putative baseplate assembly protein [Nocardioides sp. cx-173]UGB43669.1 putative baseplate assembly protein [Nocardioides sp. cx-173]
MDPLVFRCLDAEVRRAAIAATPALNAIDWLEVADLVPTELPPAQQAAYSSLPPGPQREQLLWQRKLTVRFVNDLTATHQAGLSASGILLLGGERIPAPSVAVLATGTDGVTLRTSVAGDTSRYRLEIVRSAIDRRPPEGFDPLLNGVDFTFKVDCPSDLDCRQGHVCLGDSPTQPRLDYLAKDYASFRRLMLDRISLLSPTWSDRSPADLGVALVELFAYVGDRLSYAQDAVATEAYLGTARFRRSVRRHARLVDYAMHDGCNARTWVQVRVSADVDLVAGDLRFLTRLPELPARVAPGSRDETRALASRAQWFEPVVAELDRSAAPVLHLRAAHDAMAVYDWAFPDFALPPGTTEATLAGHFPDLAEGDVLVLAQTKSPVTGQAADADPTQRHAVRLTSATAFDGPAPLTDPLTAARITQVTWAPADALPFGLCVTASGDIAAGRSPVTQGAQAWGNVVLADHGRTVTGEVLGTASGARFRPTLAEAPLTQASTVRVRGPHGASVRRRFDPAAPAAYALVGDPAAARPALWPRSVLDGDATDWTAVPDLLDAGAESPEVVAELEADGVCRLRFGSHGHGRTPRSAEAFTAAYRHGNGAAGNVGADSLGHVVTADGRVTGVRNPVPAVGGTEPETIEQARRRAPEAFRTQRRAVTPADYERVSMQSPTVQRAAATLRWTGSWHTVFLTVDPAGETGTDTLVDADFEQALLEHLEPFRLAGYDLEIDGPRFVALELELEVCVAADHFRSEVRQRLAAALSARDNGDGTRGHFHPDTFTFGQAVHVSPILARARAVTGVDSARAVVFQRLGSASPVPLAEGRLTLGRLEVARLENDPDFPEHGVLRIVLHGGK